MGFDAGAFEVPIPGEVFQYARRSYLFSNETTVFSHLDKLRTL